jgi:hypothetical protein
MRANNEQELSEAEGMKISSLVFSTEKSKVADTL